ncbi:hypothetical protein KP509_18G018300 [Ceratopteris richardii]|uniref:Disease resistance R13L4/SHOC-2-like LRR domain-containing protein n=1 Tax=Ceratopteris richardii TaxID=49495 RepID=A0A8T2SMW3_CERRI|nr:hypothetical protein KP509_18G018300 [Ceratopteris richardii]KAH7365281.1 hypothetical protein KP509_18G018300 [Ceratopteris richardii]
MGLPTASLDEVIAQMLALQKALPERPSFPELEIAIATVAKIDEALVQSQREVLRQPRPEDVPASVFSAFQEMRLEALEHKAKDQKKRSERVIKLEERHRKYDLWIRKAHSVLSGTGMDEELDGGVNLDGGAEEGSETVEVDDMQGSARSVLDATWEFPPSESSLTSSVGVQTTSVDGHDLKLSNSKLTHHRSESFSRIAQSLSWDRERSNTIMKIGEEKTAVSFLSKPDADETKIRDESSTLVSEKARAASALGLVDPASSQRQTCLDLRGATLKEIEWIPESIGTMTWLIEVNLSRNRLTTLPDSIGNLVHLTNLDASLNQLVTLPDTIGQLTCLKTLILDNNKIEELPYTIGQCTSLVELRASFNKLKALPEATGKLTQLRYLDVHWNKLGSLPSTIGSMASLVDLDASFNEISHIPEGLCQVTTLTRLNFSSNFNELQELPEDIGNLQKLKALNLSCNQLKVLPDSFALLTNLQDLDLSGNFMRVPPKHIADQGAEAVLKYMSDMIAERERDKYVVKKRSLWTLFFACGKSSMVEEDFVAK